MSEQPHWLRVTEAARYVGLDRATVYRLVGLKRIRHYRIGAGAGKIVFRAADLDAYLASCVVEAGEPADAPRAGGLKHLRPRGGREG